MERLKNGEVVMNRWVIDEYIGSGRYGVVYKAHDNSTGEIAAVKIISLPNESLIRDFETLIGGGDEAMEAFFDQMANRFVAEVESLRRVNSVNAIKYIDHAASKRGLYWDIIIVMEYANTLTRYMEEHPLTYGDIFALGIGVTNVLERCAELKILHRDIKEDNLFVGYDGVFKVGDFGAANLAATGSQGVMTNGIGSPYYMAPEVETSERYSASVDIYSLGIVLYRLLNYKRFPFMPRSTEQISQDDNARAFGERRSGKPLPPPEFCPEPLIPVILRACEYDPARRYASATEMKQDLINALNFIQQQSPDILETVVKMPEGRKPRPNHNTVPTPPTPQTPPTPPTPPTPQATVQTQPPVYTPPQEVTYVMPSDNNGETVPLGINPNPNMNGNQVPPVGPAGYPPTMPANEPPMDASAGMKTTDAIKEFMKKFGKDSAPVSKMIEKIQALDKANGEIKRQQREIKKKKRNMIIAAIVSVILLIALVLSLLFGVDYRSNKKDSNKIYRYFFGFPIKDLCEDEAINSWFVTHKGDWIYFSWHNAAWESAEDLNLYKIDKSGENLTRVCTDRSEYLVYHDGYLYYINTNDKTNPTLCRVKADAEDAQGEVIYDDADFPLVIDNGLGISGDMIKFTVYDVDDPQSVENKYYSVPEDTFYADKK